MICPNCHLEKQGGYHSAEFCIESLAEVISHTPIGGMIRPRPEVNHEAYCWGLCCDCAEVPHMAGRVRCAKCHEAWEATLPQSEPQLQRGQRGTCMVPGCEAPSPPGILRCPPHARAKGIEMWRIR